jgi:hypothetical protein
MELVRARTAADEARRLHDLAMVRELENIRRENAPAKRRAAK